MTPTPDARPTEKVFAGARLRRLRRERGLTQGEAAEALGLSASYLNLLERNQRPVTARVLLALADVFDIDVRGFAQESDKQLVADLEEAAADPALAPVGLDRVELAELAESQPRAAEAFARLYQAYRDSTGAAADLIGRISTGGGGAGAAAEAVRDALDAGHNHFPELEEAADALREAIGLTARNRMAALETRLQEGHGVVTRVFGEEVMGGVRRRLDLHARRLMLSDSLPMESRPFHMAACLALLEAGELIDRLADAPGFQTKEARAMYRISLAGYFAGALLMPYADFLKAAEDSRYDIAVLMRRFEAGFETVCHRLTTLNRPGARGVSFFLIRVDAAGNVSKRHGGGVLPFARAGGGCPKWSLYETFRAPERIIAQSFELPDGSRYLSAAKAVIRDGAPGEPPVMQAVAVGCDWADAGKVVYADALKDAAPAKTGLACRVCERADCGHRAFPPLNRKLLLDPWRRDVSPYAFEPD
ncbi:MAG: DUF2083 domain-containing protein [Maricaulaceae bacterium]|nr:DUF2083 domain-containing protein [Maricaulaceae bacterium]